MYSFDGCPYCYRAKALLDRLELDFIEYNVMREPPKWEEMLQRARRDSVPQIFIDDRHIGGSDELVEAWQTGTLQKMLDASPV